MKMKQMILMAAAAVTVFTSCSKNDEVFEPSVGDKVLKVSLTNPPRVGTRAIEAVTPTTGLTAQNGDGIIFITDQAGTVKRAIPFDPTFPGTASTQTITGVVSTDKVYVIANIGDDMKTSWTTENIPADVAAINALFLQIEDPTYGQTYSKATLANANSEASSLTINGDTATATVAISPVYSRLELKNVVGAPGTGSGSITSFDVVGVYVDDYYTQYTLGGSYEPTAQLYSIGQNTTISNIAEMKNEGTWSSATSIATPGASTAWVYSVTSGNVPRFVIKLDNVVGTFENGNPIPSNQTYFLTVRSYTSFTDTNFVRAKVYHVDNLTFVPSNLQTTPNPVNVDLTVDLTVTQWSISNIGTILM